MNIKEMSKWKEAKLRWTVLQFYLQIIGQTDAAAFVLVAAYARVVQGAVEIGLYDILHHAAASAHHLYLVTAQHIDGSVAHVACQHNLNTHVVQFGCYVALAAAAHGRVHPLKTDGLAVCIESADGIELAVSEVVVYGAVFSCR